VAVSRTLIVLNVRFDGEVAILSNFGGLLNDPRHFDTSRNVRNILDQGYRKFVFELAGIREMGSTAFGLLMTLTRQIQRGEGEAVLARLSRETKRAIEEMQLDDFWEIFDEVEDAMEYFRQEPT
jgi:anti-sigma B factor antagonist